ncbi:MAG: hypothetical protein KGN84_06265 [Acidobacteriota bacterium]|nr:hypothetical protein [Acidobacteriota bacterium]
MIEPGDNLRKALHEWKAPQPGRSLDDRVWKSYASARRVPHPIRTRLAIAAGLLLAGAISLHLSSGPPRPRVVQVRTTTTAEGFEPLPDGAITITKSGAKQ